MLGEVLANIRNDRKHMTQSHICCPVQCPTPLQDHDTGVTELVQHFWLAQFLHWDGTLELEETVARPGEIVRVCWVEIHLLHELDIRVLRSKVNEVSRKVGGDDLGRFNFKDSDILRELLLGVAGTDNDLRT